jgi:hypothetical protein
LLGVICADAQIKDEERHRLLNILDRFVPSDSDARKLTHSMIRGVREHQIYAKLTNI